MTSPDPNPSPTTPNHEPTETLHLFLSPGHPGLRGGRGGEEGRERGRRLGEGSGEGWSRAGALLPVIMTCLGFGAFWDCLYLIFYRICSDPEHLPAFCRLQACLPFEFLCQVTSQRSRKWMRRRPGGLGRLRFSSFKFGGGRCPSVAAESGFALSMFSDRCGEGEGERGEEKEDQDARRTSR